MAQHNLLGNEGETLAAQFLLDGGYTILARNLRISRIEVDIIAQKGDILHIVEVKSRREFEESALLSFDETRRERLIRASELYISAQSLDLEISLDLITVIFRQSALPLITHYEAVQ